MKSKYILTTEIASTVLVPIFLAFLDETIRLMIPWLVVMFVTVMADLAAGLWKAIRLEIPIRFSKACRETMGKLVVYFTFTLMACCIDVASNSEFRWAKWLCLFVILIEIGSIVGNILKPRGINLSLNAWIKAIMTHSSLPFNCPNPDEILIHEDVERIREEEMRKLEEIQRKKHHGKRHNHK